MGSFALDAAVFFKLRNIVLNKIGRRDLIYIDVDGCLMPESEHARAVAYAELIDSAFKQLPQNEVARKEACQKLMDAMLGGGENERVRAEASAKLFESKLGKDKEISNKDLALVHDLLAGPPVDLTILKIKEAFGLKESLETILSEHDKMYFDLVKDQEPNPYIMEVIRIAQEEGIRIVFLSNGRDNGIRSILKHFGIKGLDNAVYAYDSPCRNINGEREADKVKCLGHITRTEKNSEGGEIENVLAFEDSFGTADRLGKNSVIANGKVVVAYVDNGHNPSEAPASSKVCLKCAKQPHRPQTATNDNQSNKKLIRGSGFLRRKNHG